MFLLRLRDRKHDAWSILYRLAKGEGQLVCTNISCYNITEWFSMIYFNFVFSAIYSDNSGSVKSKH